MRILNTLEGVRANFYYDSHNLEMALRALGDALHFPPETLLTLCPSGHFHCSPAATGLLLSRGQHVVCHIASDLMRAVLDIYGCDDSDLSTRTAVNSLVLEHFQPAMQEIMPSVGNINFPQGTYANFRAAAVDFSYLVDLVFRLEQHLDLRPMSTLFLDPPLDASTDDYDLVRVGLKGYIAVHTVPDGITVDLLSPAALTAERLERCFRGITDLRLLPRMIQI